MYAFIPSRRRTGFTLVEVLVVTGILAILFALATGVAIRALITAQEARVTAEMRQLESAIASFKTSKGVSYLPSRFRLYPNIGSYFSAANANDPLTKASRDYLYQIWPRLDKNATNINWVPNLSTVAPGGIDLNGSECLVFFLGGPDGLSGFSKNPLNPIPPPGTKGEVSFEFDVKRLRSATTGPVTPFCQRTPGPSGTSVGSSVPSNAAVYMDGFASGDPKDQPYYYFTSYKLGNDYDSLDRIVIPSSSYQVISGFTEVQMSPHRDQSGRFYNPNGFQLISAGRDKRVGNFALSTTNWFVVWENGVFYPPPPATPPSRIDLPPEPSDNLCNFHPVKMGIPQ
jgi:prepilin-type N-terminal cleavage/methylation domain-containing protein